MPINLPVDGHDSHTASLALREETLRVDSHVESVITKTKCGYNFVFRCAVDCSAWILARVVRQ